MLPRFQRAIQLGDDYPVQIAPRKARFEKSRAFFFVRARDPLLPASRTTDTLNLPSKEIQESIHVEADIGTGLIWFVAFLFSTTVHEAMHAFAAWRLGDSTAYHGGQVSLNPMPHIKREPIGMLLLPLLTSTRSPRSPARRAHRS